MASHPSQTRPHALPWLGLGLSTNLDARDVPHPYRLLDEEPGLFDFVEYSAPLSVEEARAQASLFPEMWRRRDEVPVLFHPVHLNLWGPEPEAAGALAALDAHLREVGSPWVGNDVGWWHAGGTPLPGYLYVSPPLDAAGVEEAAAHARHVQAHLSVPLVLENPAVLARRGDLHVLDFMARVHAATGAPLLLDLGHLLSAQLAAGLPLDAGLDGFPLERVVEVHLAGGVVTRRGARGLYVDDHTQPVREELFDLLAGLLPRLPALRAVTFEGDGHPPEVAALTLRRLRSLLPRRPREALEVEVPVAATPPPEPPALDAARAWDVFRAVHAGEGEDVEGAREERDFRLAVLAQVLDEAFPLSRLLVAGTREALGRFMASEPYRRAFAPGSRGVTGAFAAWARTEALAATRGAPPARAQGVLAALSLDAMLPTLLATPAGPTPGPGQVGLAPDVRVGSFPADLTELAFAVRALRRHLGARAWTGETLETSGLEALAQVAARTGRGPWNFAVRARGQGGEVLALPPGLAPLATRLGRTAEALGDGPLPRPVAEGLARGLLRRG